MLSPEHLLQWYRHGYVQQRCLEGICGILTPPVFASTLLSQIPKEIAIYQWENNGYVPHNCYTTVITVKYLVRYNRLVPVWLQRGNRSSVPTSFLRRCCRRPTAQLSTKLSNGWYDRFPGNAARQGPLIPSASSFRHLLPHRSFSSVCCKVASTAQLFHLAHLHVAVQGFRHSFEGKFCLFPTMFPQIKGFNNFNE